MGIKSAKSLKDSQGIRKHQEEGHGRTNGDENNEYKTLL